MSYGNPRSKSCSANVGSTALASLLVGVAAVVVAAPALAAHVTPPPVPIEVEVESGNVAFLVGHAIGTQNYVCLPSGAAFAWVLFTPEATLFDDQGKQIITHYFSPNPDELNTNPRVEANGMIRATWQSQDTSTVWGEVRPGDSSTDSDFVAPGAVAWLLVTKAGIEDGPSGRSQVRGTTFIQRLNTSGGVAPLTGCASPADVGRQAFVPYTADYFFYRSADDDEDDEN